LPQLIGKKCGVLLDEPTPENLAAAVEIVCSDAERYNRMSAAAVATAQHYSLEDWRDSIGETLRQSWQVVSLSSAAEPTTIFE
jgi:glycosyltransferase involved in cell wall biosynthesis